MENYEEGLTKFEIGETPVSLGDRLQHVRNKIGFMLGMFAGECIGVVSMYIFIMPM